LANTVIPYLYLLGLRRSALKSFPLRHNILSERRIFLHAMLKTPSSRWSGVYARRSCWDSKESALEEGEKPEPEPRERTLTVSKFTEGFGLIDVLEDIEW